MARTSRGLGRGLAALIDPSPEPERALVDLDLDRIAPNPRQPRAHIEPEALAALAASIRADGVVQPVVVREGADGRYELIAGERRWRAARAAGLTTIPAIVRSAGDGDSLLLALVENVVREDLNAVEVARGYAALIDDLGLSAAEVAERVGRSRSGVVNTVRLLELPDDVLELIARGALSEGHGRAILQARDHGERRALARRAVQEELSVRQTEALARGATSRRRRRRAPAWFDEASADDVVDACYQAFGLSARVTPLAAECRVEVRVGSPDELAALVEGLEELARVRAARPA